MKLKVCFVQLLTKQQAENIQSMSHFVHSGSVFCHGKVHLVLRPHSSMTITDGDDDDDELNDDCCDDRKGMSEHFLLVPAAVANVIFS